MDKSKIIPSQIRHQIQEKEPVPFYFGKVGNKYLLTNDGGDYFFLTEDNFKKFVNGELSQKSKVFSDLHERNFIKCDYCLADLIKKYRSRNAFLFEGPSLHIVVVTLRCNHKCLYCHASAQDMSRKDLDMTEETARKAVEMIFKSPSPFISIEFQGGEPLVNWPVVKLIIDEAYKRNKEAKKNLIIRLVSNFSLMTEEIFNYLLDKKVSLCSSLDGPEKLHNRNRPATSGNSYWELARWIKKFYRLYPKLKKNGYIYQMDALITITRFSLLYPKEIVDEYVKFGFKNIYLRPLNPFGFSLKIWDIIGYPPADFIDFYKKALSYIIQLNLKGKKFKERMAVIFLTKILTGKDPNHLDYRSPCGAGIGQMAYNWNGDVYTCDEGRMLAMMGDESFRLGSVLKNDYKEIIASPVIRTVCTASCLEGLAGCSDCVFKPYCGVCPIFNYFTQGNIFGQMPVNDRCAINKAILGYLLEKLEDKTAGKILKSWVI